MLKAVLLDLDNTLVLYDELVFYERYFNNISAFFTDLFPPDEFQERVVRAALSLYMQNGVLNNRDFFMARFLDGHDRGIDAIWHRFEDYYVTEFPKIAVSVEVPNGLHRVLNRLRELDLKLILASNPIFPRPALDARIAWAGIDPDLFSFVTDMETMSHVKPQEAYYRQIATQIGEIPSACLMVGNDRINDLVAAKMGMKTFLATEAEEVDYSSLRLTEDEINLPRDIPPPDFEGPLLDVIDAVEQLIII